MSTQENPFFAEIASYYNLKLSKNGETPQGVDWNGLASQEQRFDQLCKIIPDKNYFSLNDLGCGYAALLDYLQKRQLACRYIGIDISEKMIDAAKRRHDKYKDARFIINSKPDKISDFSIASGIFNVRLKKNDLEWFSYMRCVLDNLNFASARGFAFNCLTAFSESDKKKDYLYYAEPFSLVQLCMQRYSRNVALLHDYGLYEFTILVRKKL